MSVKNSLYINHCVCDRERERIQNIYEYEVRLKISRADNDTLIECNQIKFILQHRPSCGQHNSYIGVAVLGFHLSKKLSTKVITSSFELLRSPWLVDMKN